MLTHRNEKASAQMAYITHAYSIYTNIHIQRCRESRIDRKSLWPRRWWYGWHTRICEKGIFCALSLVARYIYTHLPPMFNQRSRSPSPHPITISCTMHKCTRKYREQKKSADFIHSRGPPAPHWGLSLRCKWHTGAHKCTVCCVCTVHAYTHTHERCKCKRTARTNPYYILHRNK